MGGKEKRILFSVIFLFTLLSLTSSVFAVSVSITPSNPDTDDSLKCLVDGEYNSLYQYQWRRDGNLYSGSLSTPNRFPASLTTRDQEISCTVYAPFGFFIGIDSVAIRNSAPEITSTKPTIASLSRSEGDSASFRVYASDLDNDDLEYQWKRNGANVGTDSNGYSYTFNQNGTYVIKVIVSDGDKEDSFQWTVAVLDANPKGNIEMTDDPVEGQDITFSAVDVQDNPVDQITRYVWYFSNSVTRGGEEVDYSYTQDGSKTVTLRIYDEDSYTSVIKTFNVADVDPDVNINNPNTINVDEGDTVNFDSAITTIPEDDLDYLVWDFGDGDTSSSADPSHVYSDNGTYTVKLTAYDEDSSASDSITVNVADVDPSGEIDANDTNINEGEIINFRADNLVPGSSSDEIDRVEWDFGDGDTSDEEDVDHRFEDDGIFNARLRIYDEDSFVEDIIAITVNDVDPVADFSFSPLNPNEGQSVAFDAGTSTDNTYDEIDRVEWDFGDGETGNGEVENHVFSDSGTYTVTLTITDEDSSDTFNLDVVVSNVDPSGNISGPSSVLEGEEVDFTVLNLMNGASTDAVSSIEWDFGDGETGSGENVTHVYSDNGTYTVTVTINDEDSSITDSMDVVVLDRNISGAIDVNDTTVYEGQSARFTVENIVDHPSDEFTSVLWDFDEGITSNLETIDYVFTNNGVHNVTLTLFDEDSSYTRNVLVIVADVNPTVYITYDPNLPIVEGTPVTFEAHTTASSADQVSLIVWTFSDGITMAGALATRSFSNNGTYLVRVNVSDEDSMVSSTTTISFTDSAPVANFSFSPSNPLAGETVSFTDLTLVNADIPLSYSWDFNNDGPIDSITQNPTYTYNSDGWYTIKLLVRDNDGSTSNILKNIPVGNLNLPPAVTIYSPLNGSEYVLFGPILFNGTAVDNFEGTLPATSLSWYSNINGFLGNGYSFSRNNLSLGMHNITLSAFDSDGLVTNESVVINITGDTGYLINTYLDGVYYANTSTQNMTNIDFSIIIDSILQNPVTITGSQINNSDIADSIITDSVVNNSVLDNCVVINSIVKDVIADGCFFRDSYVDPSNLTGSEVSGGSNIINSNVTYSDVDESNITNSSISYSGIYNSTILNSSFNNFTVVNANITDNTIYSGNVTYGNFTYDADVNGSANITDVINLPPNAVMDVNPDSGNINTIFEFNASNSSDPNVGGLLNDSLSYFWDFGDGTNSTEINVTHQYTNQGDYDIVLTVTDSFGLTSSLTQTLDIADVDTGGGSGGGGGGGGGGSDVINIGVVNETAKYAEDVTTSDRIKFKVGVNDYELRVITRSSSQTKLKLVQTDETIIVNFDKEVKFNLIGSRKLLVKYLEYELRGSTLSLRLEPLPVLTTTAPRSSTNNTVVSQPQNVSNDLDSITGNVAVETSRPKVWIGILVFVVIVILGLGLYLAIARLFK